MCSESGIKLSGLEFTTFCTSLINVRSSSSSNSLFPTVLFREYFTSPTILSTSPFFHGALSVTKIHLIS
ncbi:unnamed protein product [Meloidogyne enterolobii]|uniref:Uncharacterized protein n=1 Tax=Meloidogyne enterolobii TaxID=390850 RepID=A0ACB1AWA7_MELEN